MSHESCTGKTVVIIGFPAEQIAATARIITGEGRKFSKDIAGEVEL